MALAIQTVADPKNDIRGSAIRFRCRIPIIKNVKQVETPKDVYERSLKPTVNLAPGKYKLRMWLLIISKEQSASEESVARFKSPTIDIDYSK